jgi:hypothetical protein
VESAGAVGVIVTRAGGTRGAVAVTLTTVAGTASAGSDFAATTTAVAFAAGDASAKTVMIRLGDDDVHEANETFTVRLTAASGGATLGSPASATITIIDDDAAADIRAGLFTGGPVRGLHYRTPTQSGLTDGIGTFFFLPGERVTFSIGGIELGSALGAPQINLFTLAGLALPRTELALRTEINSPYNITDFDRVANRAHLLFALDNDHNAANGIDLGNRDAQLANATLSFEFPRSQFAFDEFRRFAGLHVIAYKFSPELPLVHLYRSLGITVAAHAIRTVSDAESGSRQIIELDGEGRLFHEVSEFDNNGDGIADDRRTKTVSYNDAGNITSVASELDNGANGTLDERETTAATYDFSENRIGDVRDSDFDLSGTIDTREVRTHSYDVAGNLLTTLSEADFDANGAVDRRTREVKAYTFDIAGRVLTLRFDLDSGADGSINFQDLEFVAYDSAGNLSSIRHEMDRSGEIADGTIDSVQTFTFENDAAGNRRSETLLIDTDANGVSDSIERLTFERDDAGNETSHRIESDQNADGTPNSMEKQTTSYDAAGNVLSTRQELDDNADGVVDRVVLFRREYGVDGNVLSSVTESNGAVSSNNTFGNVLLTDGLGYLLREGR